MYKKKKVKKGKKKVKGYRPWRVADATSGAPQKYKADPQTIVPADTAREYDKTGLLFVWSYAASANARSGAQAISFRTHSHNGTEVVEFSMEFFFSYVVFFL